MRRVYYHFSLLEEHQFGLWRTINGEKRKKLLDDAIKFTSNAEAYGKAMKRVVNEWPKSCEHNLTCMSMNRQAWIGHAAACLQIGVPEDITREAWRFLSKTQQDEANAKADEAISFWRKTYKVKRCQNKQLEFQF